MTAMSDGSRRSKDCLAFAQALSYLEDAPSADRFIELERSFAESVVNSRLTRSQLLVSSWQAYLTRIIQNVPADGPINLAVLLFCDVTSPANLPVFELHKKPGSATVSLVEAEVPSVSTGYGKFSNPPAENVSDQRFSELDKILVKYAQHILDSKLSVELYDDDSRNFFSKLRQDLPDCNVIRVLSEIDSSLYPRVLDKFLSLLRGTRIEILLLAGRVLDLKKSKVANQSVWLQTLEQLSSNVNNLPSLNLVAEQLGQVISASQDFAASILGKSSLHLGDKNYPAFFVISSLNELDTECAFLVSKENPNRIESSCIGGGLFAEDTHRSLSYLLSFFDSVKSTKKLVNEPSKHQSIIWSDQGTEDTQESSLFELVNAEYLKLFKLSVDFLAKVNSSDSSADLADKIDELCKRCYSKIGSSSLPFMVASFASILINIKYHPRKAIKRIDSLVNLIKNRGVSDQEYFEALSKIKIVCLDRLGRDREVWQECNSVNRLLSSDSFENIFFIEYSLKSAYNLKLDFPLVESRLKDLRSVASESTNANLPHLLESLYYAIRLAYLFGKQDLLIELSPRFIQLAESSPVDYKLNEVRKILSLSKI